MRIGLIGGGIDVDQASIDDIVAAAGTAADQGFRTYWLPQGFGHDALTVLTIVGREVPRIELGTAFVPTHPRHPVALASQALTTHAATGGRLTLGVGLLHQFVVEATFGYSFAKPVRHMREYVSILMPLLRGEKVVFRGESLSANAMVSLPDAPAPPPVLVAALGSQMLNVAGRLADGTVTWMAGADALREHIVPTITSAAKEAGRTTPPLVVAGLPVCVTDDPATTALAEQGALVGDEEQVTAAIRAIADAGATEFSASEVGRTPDERERTRMLLRALLPR